MSTSCIIIRKSNQCADVAAACRGMLSILWIEFPLVTNIERTRILSSGLIEIFSQMQCPGIRFPLAQIALEWFSMREDP